MKDAVTNTITYFNLFDYPLSISELYRFLLVQNKTYDYFSLGHLVNTIDSDVIDHSNGLYYLKNRASITRTRHNRYLIAEQKMRTTKKIVAILSYIPFVRLIMASNSIAYHNTTESSDIDLVLVAKKGGVWWVRFISLMFLSLLRMRPGYKNKKEKICVSVFIDEEYLDLGSLRMHTDDIDFSYWVLNFYPLYDAEDYYNRFWEANRRWLAEYFPHAQKVIPNQRRFRTHKPRIRFIIEPFLLVCSSVVQKVQEKGFPKEIKDLINKDTRVRVEKGLLKFHVNDRREEHNREFKKAVKL